MPKPVEALIEGIRERTASDLVTWDYDDLEQFWRVLRARMFIDQKVTLDSEGAKKLETKIDTATEIARTLGVTLGSLVSEAGLDPMIMPLVLDLMRAALCKTEVEISGKHEHWKEILELSAELEEQL